MQTNKRYHCLTLDQIWTTGSRRGQGGKSIDRLQPSQWLSNANGMHCQQTTACQPTVDAAMNIDTDGSDDSASANSQAFNLLLQKALQILKRCGCWMTWWNWCDLMVWWGSLDSADVLCNARANLIAGHRHHQDNSFNFIGASNHSPRYYLVSRVGLAKMSWFGFIVLPSFLHDRWRVDEKHFERT